MREDAKVRLAETIFGELGLEANEQDRAVLAAMIERGYSPMYAARYAFMVARADQPAGKRLTPEPLPAEAKAREEEGIGI